MNLLTAATVSFQRASAALATALAGIEIEIVAAVRVALRAMSFQGPITAPHMISMGQGFQVIWPYAITDAAQVVKLHPFGDWADQKLVGEAVRENDSTILAEDAIAFGIPIGRPVPMVRFSTNLGPEPLFRSHGYIVP